MLLLHGLDQAGDGLAGVPDDRHVRGADLAGLRGVDVGVRDLRVRAKLSSLPVTRPSKRVPRAISPGHPLGNQQVRFLQHGDGRDRTVYARHSHMQRVAVAERTERHRVVTGGSGPLEVRSRQLPYGAASSVPGLMFLYGALASLGFSAASGVTAGLVVRHWFTERRGLAFGLVESGFGAGQFVFTPLSLFLIEAYGWRTTLVVESVLLTVVVGPLVTLLLRSTPADRGLEPYGGPDLTEIPEHHADQGGGGLTAREVLPSPLLWGLLAPFFVCGVTTTGLMDTHLVSIAHEHGASTALTGTAVSLLVAANLAGAVASGPLSDRYCARILAVLYGVRALILVLLALAPYGAWLVVISVAFGLVDFATVAPTHLITTRNFPASSLGLVFGTLSMAHQVGSALGSYLPGLLFDLTASYTPTLLGCSTALIAAVIGCLATLPGNSSAVGAVQPQPPAPAPAGEQRRSLRCPTEASNALTTATGPSPL